GMTTVDMSGAAIYENATQAWVQDYGNASAPNNGWVFSNTTVNAASADLKGVGFNHSNLTINNGNLNITNNASSSLANNNITVTNGSFSVLAKAGSLSLSGTNITANNISVQVNRGGVLLNGAVVNSTVGGLDIVAGLGDINVSTSCITAVNNVSLRAMTGAADLTNAALNSSTGAVSVTAKGGDLTLGAGNISANSTVALNSGGNITLNGATVTGHGDISLLGAGNSTARIQVLNSTLASNGGNITLDRLSTTDAEGNTVTNPNAMTVKVSNSTLNATNASSGGTNGNISIRAYNPNVNLSISAYKNTVRNNDSMIEVSGSSTLTGNNVTLHSELSGANAKGLPVLLNNTTITADNDIAITSNLSGVTNKSMSAIELRNKNTLNATAGNITISNLRTDTGTGKGVFLNGSSAGAVSLTAGKDIILN
ncbi:hypothetical protein O5M67_004743, partial [Salmonella enterica]|nr:hypothetical protein [Salmonella enterica]EBM1423061.1 hypothetical protein [Salmonella enterica]EBN3387869.1 hypothetical protein [Salmonella enterica]EBN8560288.1 hypothetical protein [Salmonella enterica]EIE5432231.1 hypothetical protein [Salmonella enterica]